MSTERVIVDRSIAKAFEAALREAAKSIQDKRFDLVRKNAVGELKTLVDDAIQAVSLGAASVSLAATDGPVSVGCQTYPCRAEIRPHIFIAHHPL